MKFTRRIYGPGPRPGSRVLLAIPGQEVSQEEHDRIMFLAGEPQPEEPSAEPKPKPVKKAATKKAAKKKGGT